MKKIIICLLLILPSSAFAGSLTDLLSYQSKNNEREASAELFRKAAIVLEMEAQERSLNIRKLKLEVEKLEREAKERQALETKASDNTATANK